MIKSVTVTNHLGDSVKLELTRPEKSGFVIKNIEGLGPVKANINTTKLASGDGAIYNSAYADQRDIVISLLFLQIGNETIEDIRHKSYKYFPIKKKVQLVIETDRRTVKTEGYVEANEPNIFSANEGCSITIACPDPYLYSLEMNEVTFSGVEPMFEFPFENDSMTEPLLNFGEIKKKSEEVVYYEGDLEVGMTINIHALGEVSDLKIYNVGTGESMVLSSHRIGVMTGHYTEYIPGTTYLYRSIVIYKNNLWVVPYTTTGSAWGPPDTDKWLKITGDYDPWNANTTYDPGSMVTHNDKIWIYTRQTSSNNVEPGSDKDKGVGTMGYDENGVYWMDLTDKYPCVGIKAGDVITINTKKGKKGVTILRDGVTTNIINCLNKNADWFTLTKGDNIFAYDTDEGSSYVEFRISSDIGYDGV